MKKLFFIIFLLFIITSCSTSKKNIIVKESPEIMYNKAMEALKSSRFNFAADNFEKIDNLYPFNEYAKKGVMMSAYAYYKANKFEDSLRQIEYFKKISFSKEDIEYIYYLEILNNYTKIKKTGKDLELIKLTINLIDTMIYKFYNSKYKDDLMHKKKYLTDIVASNELEIAKFYLSNSNLVGAINHLKMIIDKYPDTKYNAEIFYRLYELYSHLNYKEGKDFCYTVLKESFKDTKWFKYAK